MRRVQQQDKTVCKLSDDANVTVLTVGGGASALEYRRYRTTLQNSRQLLPEAVELSPINNGHARSPGQVLLTSRKKIQPQLLPVRMPLQCTRSHALAIRVQVPRKAGGKMSCTRRPHTNHTHAHDECPGSQQPCDPSVTVLKHWPCPLQGQPLLGWHHSHSSPSQQYTCMPQRSVQSPCRTDRTGDSVEVNKTTAPFLFKVWMGLIGNPADCVRGGHDGSDAKCVCILARQSV